MSNPPIIPAQEQQQVLYNQYQSAVNQLQLINQQINQVANVIEELRINITTLEGFSSNPTDSQIVVPLGGLIFVKATLTGIDEILLNVGSNTVIPTTFEKAKTILEERLKEMTEVYTRISSDQKRLQDIASQLQSQLNDQ